MNIKTLCILPLLFTSGLFYWTYSKRSDADKTSRSPVSSLVRRSEAHSKVGPDQLMTAISGGKHSDVLDLARRWANSSPAEATSWILAEVNGRVRDELIGESIEQWTAQDPQAAFSWVVSDDAIDVWHIAADIVARGWAKSDPLGALRADLDNLDPVAAETFRVSALSAWAEESPEAAAEWLDRKSPASNLAMSVLQKSGIEHSRSGKL